MKKFQIATQKERDDALGEITHAHFKPSLYQPLTKLTSWLEYNCDKRQSFHLYSKMIDKDVQAHKLTHNRKVVYIYSMEESVASELPFLQDFLEAFLYPLTVTFSIWRDHKIPFQRSKGKKKSNEKYHVKDVLAELKLQLPSDAYCALALTKYDLMDDNFSYLIGKATLRDRVGVVSTYRYNPKSKDYIQPDRHVDFSWRVMNVVGHEVCHMFGLAHCVYNECIMNGSDTGDDRPSILCGICLKKLNWNISQIETNNLSQRNDKLLQVYQKHCPNEKVDIDVMQLLSKLDQ